jgi:hypothetical protein
MAVFFYRRVLVSAMAMGVVLPASAETIFAVTIPPLGGSYWMSPPPVYSDHPLGELEGGMHLCAKSDVVTAYSYQYRQLIIANGRIIYINTSEGYPGFFRDPANDKKCQDNAALYAQQNNPRYAQVFAPVTQGALSQHDVGPKVTAAASPPTVALTESQKMAEKRRWDTTSCNNLANHPQPDLPRMTAAQCLAMLGYTVKGSDGTIVTPPQPSLPSQQSRISQSNPATVKPPVPIAATRIAGTDFGFDDLHAIESAYNGNMPKFNRLYKGHSFGFDGTFFLKRAMNSISEGYYVSFFIRLPDGTNSFDPVFCVGINDEATIDEIDGWEKKPSNVTVIGTIIDADGGTLRLINCSMQSR